LSSRALAVLALVLALAAPATAAPEPKRIAVHVVAGRLVARCDVSTSARRLPVNLFVELENPCVLELHDQALQPLGVARGREITLRFPGFSIPSGGWALGDQEELDAFTKRYAPELGETAVVGTIGAGLLKRYHVTLDLHAGSLELRPPRPPRAPDGEAGEGEAGDGDASGALEVPADVAGDLVWLPVRGPGGATGALALGTARWDTVLDRDLCRSWGRPAGDLASLKVETVDLARFVAFRPDLVAASHEDGAFGVTGLGLLRHFRVGIDRVNRVVTLEQTAPADFPEADRVYYRARATGRAAPLEAFLEKHPGARLAPEAADLLLDRLFAAGAQDVGALQRALAWGAKTRPEDVRTTHMLATMRRLAEYGRPDLVVAAGELAVETGREDRDPNAVHEVHALLGELHLAAGRRKQAWRHLLSAAFGMPDDGRVNLALGRFYEREERYTRAFSRYVQAVIREETSPQAMRGLARVRRKMGEAERISVATIERMIAGKVPGFSAGDRFRPKDGYDTGRVVLAELFTSANLRPAIASDLGFDALRAHFPRERVAVLAHHVRAGAPTPLLTPVSSGIAAEVELPRAPFAIFDGILKVPSGGREHHKERHYLFYKERVLERLRIAAKHRIEIDAVVEDGVVKGRAVVHGPRTGPLRLKLLLVENGVVFPGPSRIVVHHDVVRGALRGGWAGVPYEPEDGAMTIRFERSLEDIRDEANRYLIGLAKRGVGLTPVAAPRIDPQQVTIVACLRDKDTGEVKQALQIDPRRPADAIPGRD